MTTERHLNKKQLEDLMSEAERCDMSCDDARFKLKTEMEKAKSNGLNPWAWRIARQLWKQDPSKAAHNIRALTLYIDMLGLAAQADLEDIIADEEDDPASQAVH